MKSSVRRQLFPSSREEEEDEKVSNLNNKMTYILYAHNKRKAQQFSSLEGPVVFMEEPTSAPFSLPGGKEIDFWDANIINKLYAYFQENSGPVLDDDESPNSLSTEELFPMDYLGPPIDLDALIEESKDFYAWQEYMTKALETFSPADESWSNQFDAPLLPLLDEPLAEREFAPAPILINGTQAPNCA